MKNIQVKIVIGEMEFDLGELTRIGFETKCERFRGIFENVIKIHSAHMRCSGMEFEVFEDGKFKEIIEKLDKTRGE